MKYLLITLSFLVLATPPLRADEGVGAELEGRFGKRLEEFLELDADQKEKVAAIRKKHRDGMKEARKALRAERKAIIEALQDSKRTKEYDDELKARHAKLQAFKREIEQKRFATLLEIRSVLSDSQVAKFKELRKGIWGRIKAKWNEWKNELNDEE